MPVPELLQRLLVARGPSGYETEASAVWREAAAAFAEVTTDTLGSSFARVPGHGGPRVALLCHVDEIGVTVTHVTDEGFLLFAKLGGFFPEVLLGQRVEVLAREGPVAGVIARRRDLTRTERAAPDWKDLHIDIGARDGEEARSVVRPGDPAVLVAPPVELRNGRLTGRALDNRVGCYVALESARRLAGAGAAAEVIVVAAVQEEIGGAGARAAVFGLEPKLAIVLDVTSATDVPGGDPAADGERRLGSGPAIARGPTVHPALFDLLWRAAEAEGIAATVEVAGWSTASDAEVIHLSRAGIPTALVSVPLRYMHSAAEVVQLDDVEAAVRLIEAVVRGLGPGSDFAR